MTTSELELVALGLGHPARTLQLLTSKELRSGRDFERRGLGLVRTDADGQVWLRLSEEVSLLPGTDAGSLRERGQHRGPSVYRGKRYSVTLGDEVHRVTAAQVTLLWRALQEPSRSVRVVKWRERQNAWRLERRRLGVVSAEQGRWTLLGANEVSLAPETRTEPLIETLRTASAVPLSRAQERERQRAVTRAYVLLPVEVWEEIAAEARRLERSGASVLRLAWHLARQTIRATPSSTAERRRSNRSGRG